MSHASRARQWAPASERVGGPAACAPKALSASLAGALAEAGGTKSPAEER